MLILIQIKVSKIKQYAKKYYFLLLILKLKWSILTSFGILYKLLLMVNKEIIKISRIVITQISKIAIKMQNILIKKKKTKLLKYLEIFTLKD